MGASSNGKMSVFEIEHSGSTPDVPAMLDDIYFQEYDDSCDEFNVPCPDSLVGKTDVL